MKISLTFHEDRLLIYMKCQEIFSMKIKNNNNKKYTIKVWSAPVVIRALRAKACSLCSLHLRRVIIYTDIFGKIDFTVVQTH